MIVGTTTRSTSSGVANFNSLSVYSSGNFKLSAAATNFVTTLSSQFTISNAVTVISAPNTLTTNNYFNFQLTASLIGTDNLAFIQGTLVSLSATGALALAGGITATSDTAGNAAFTTPYFAIAGAGTLVISSASSAVTKAVSVTVTQSVLTISLTNTVKFT